MKLTTEQLFNIFSGTAPDTEFYEKSKKLYTDMRTHANGEVPKKIIEERRPSESPDTKDYRVKIYVSKTKNPVSKVLQSLSKIRRSADWSIDYLTERPAVIVEEESLENYCERNYPGYDSVTNWVFSDLLKANALDANAVVAVLPMSFDVAENEYYKPIAITFHSDQVLYFDELNGEAVLRSKAKSRFALENGLQSEGGVFYVISSTVIERWEQTKDGYSRVVQQPHSLGVMPAFRLKGVFVEQLGNTVLRESRLAPMLPSLTEAAREYSDLQAAKVQHMHPLFWYYDTKDCPSCAGIGKIPEKSGAPKQCGKCNGTGKVKFSPYAHIAVDPPGLGQNAPPSPPAGYITRDVEIIKHQDESVKQHLFDALSSINMQFLDQTPLNISGEAKAVDREELNNFVYNFAEDLVYAMDKVYYFINEWRYSLVVTDKDKRRAMLPSITVPQNFDLLPSGYLVDEIKKGKDANLNPFIIAALERSYATKQFYTKPELADQIGLYFDLDPLAGFSVDEKMSLLSNKGITMLDYVISSNITSFIKRAIEEDAAFTSKTFSQQQEVIRKYGEEKLKEIEKERANVKLPDDALNQDEQ